MLNEKNEYRGLNRGFPSWWFVLLCACLVCAELVAVEKSDTINWKNVEVTTPNMLQLHPVAIFSMRKMSNFKFAPDKFSISANLSNANVMLPEVTTYYPVNSSDVAALEPLEWYQRSVAGMEVEEEELRIDGLLRCLTLSMNFALSEKHEINIGIRSLYFEKGSPPFSLVCSDAFVEDFHEYIWKDPDPFARKIYGYDRAVFYYVDKDGKELTMDAYEFLIPGIELSYYYYPMWDAWIEHRLFANFGAHLGTNTTAYNTSLDLGASYAIVRNFIAGQRSYLNLGMGLTATYNQFVKTKDAAQIYDDHLNGLAEGVVEYKWNHKSKATTFSLALDFAIQSAYKRGYGDTYGGLAFYNEDGNHNNTSHWHYAGTHLFKPMQTWSLSYAYIRTDYVLSFYVQEDLLVNNAPDIQTGINFRYFISK